MSRRYSRESRPCRNPPPQKNSSFLPNRRRPKLSVLFLSRTNAGKEINQLFGGQTRRSRFIAGEFSRISIRTRAEKQDERKSEKFFLSIALQKSTLPATAWEMCAKFLRLDIVDKCYLLFYIHSCEIIFFH